jgi:hypothetical protein
VNVLTHDDDDDDDDDQDDDQDDYDYDDDGDGGVCHDGDDPKDDCLRLKSASMKMLKIY